MSKVKVCINVSLLVVTAAILIVAQHQCNLRLQEKTQSLRANSDQPSKVATQNAQPSNPIIASPRPPVTINEPSLELLRLRGEITGIRRNLDELGQLRREEHDELKKLREENRQLRFPTLSEIFGLSDIDTNALPAIPLAVTRDLILAGLRDADAKILTDEDNFIWAETHPLSVTNGNGDLLTIKMEFYFKDGKLVSRKYVPNG